MKKIEKFLVIEVDYKLLLPKDECNYLYKLVNHQGARVGYIYCQYIITDKLKGFLVYNALLRSNFKIKGSKKTGDIKVYYKNNNKPELIKKAVVSKAVRLMKTWKNDITTFKWNNKKYGIPKGMVKNNPNNRIKYLIYRRDREK